MGTDPRKALETWTKPAVAYLDLDDGELVVVAGRQVPNLRVHRINHEFEGFRFALEHFTVDCSIEDAEHVAAIIANALAIGAGYVGWPDEDGDFVAAPFAPKITAITLGGN